MKTQMENRIFICEKKMGGVAVKVYDFANMSVCLNEFLERGAKSLGEIAMGYFRGDYKATPKNEKSLPPQKEKIHYRNLA